MLNKVVDILISLRGDSKSMRYVVTLHTHTYTQNLHNLYINKYFEFFEVILASNSLKIRS